MVSALPPRPKAITGVPCACASSGAMPKSSSAAKTNALAVRNRRSRSRVVDTAEEAHVGRGEPGQFFHLGTVAGDDQLPPGHRAECAHQQVDALVRNQARHGEIKRFPRCAVTLVCGDVDRRIDDIGVAAVAVAYALGNVFGDGDKAVDASRGAQIPAPEPGKLAAREPAERAAVEPRLRQILRLQVPGIARRRIAQADVQLVGPGANAFGDRVRARDHQLVGRQVELFDRLRHQRKILSKVPPRKRKPLDERGANRLCRPASPDARRRESRPARRAPLRDRARAAPPARSRRRPRCRASRGLGRCALARLHGRGDQMSHLAEVPAQTTAAGWLSRAAERFFAVSWHSRPVTRPCSVESSGIFMVLMSRHEFRGYKIFRSVSDRSGETRVSASTQETD